MRKGNLLDNPVYEEKRIYLTIYGKKATIVMNEKIKPVGQPSL